MLKRCIFRISTSFLELYSRYSRDIIECGTTSWASDSCWDSKLHEKQPRCSVTCPQKANSPRNAARLKNERRTKNQRRIWTYLKQWLLQQLEHHWTWVWMWTQSFHLHRPWQYCWHLGCHWLYWHQPDRPGKPFWAWCSTEEECGLCNSRRIDECYVLHKCVVCRLVEGLWRRAIYLVDRSFCCCLFGCGFGRWWCLLRMVVVSLIFL